MEIKNPANGLDENKNKNELFPIFLKLSELKTLIVGGGYVGNEKLTAVLNNSPRANIILVATEISQEIKKLSTNYPNVQLIQKEFQEEYLENKDLVIVATNDKELNRKIKEICKLKGLLTNVADTPDLCDFYLSSVVQKGSMKIAISTNGKSPTVAKRVKEVLEESFPLELDLVLDKISQIRDTLKGDFASKVKQLNGITSVLVDKPKRNKIYHNKWMQSVMVVSASIALMVLGHIIFDNLPYEAIGGLAKQMVSSLDAKILLYILGGFIAQMIDGALGMAYGVSATTFLLSLGIPPVAASASVHTSEIFTSGVSGWMHLRFKNVNNKLFKTLLLPGVAGAILGAYVLSSLSEYSYIIGPIVSTYTLILGVLIIRKVIHKKKPKAKVKNIGPLATMGGFLDSIGGGGWGPIVSSTLIAGGRNARYTIGSVNLTEFFVSFSSSLTFAIMDGLSYWQIILGLILGGSIAAPIAAKISSKLPVKTMMIMVGIVVIAVSLINIAKRLL